VHSKCYRAWARVWGVSWQIATIDRGIGLGAAQETRVDEVVNALGGMKVEV
jgi:hypothetical protein